MSTLPLNRALLINGRLVAGDDTLDVVNPVTALPFARAPRASKAQANAAVAAARAAFANWSALGYDVRRGYLEAFADAILAHHREIARVLMLERGGTLQGVLHEVTMTANAIRYFAEQRLTPTVVRENTDERIIEQHYAQGVVVAITPWNRPLTLLAYKLGPALITGNTLIAKPAPSTPLSTLMLGEIAANILPSGVFNIIVDDNDLGAHLTAHPDVDHISFTGSTATGRKVMASAASTLKRFTLELGGNDAALVLDDADIDVVAPKLFAAAMINSGQVCYATKRVYAPHFMVEGLSAVLSSLADRAILGDGFDPSTTFGPIQNRTQYEKVQTLMNQTPPEAIVHRGQQPLPKVGYFIAPTIVTNLPEHANLVQEEQFAPILPVLPYDDIGDAILRINASPYGLGGSIWTSNVERGIAIASRIESGTVWVNQHMALPLDVAFGGAKQSGMGLQNGIAGMEDFTQRRIVNAKLGALI